jgi:hypothetical protein
MLYGVDGWPYAAVNASCVPPRYAPLMSPAGPGDAVVVAPGVVVVAGDADAIGVSVALAAAVAVASAGTNAGAVGVSVDVTAAGAPIMVRALAAAISPKPKPMATSSIATANPATNLQSPALRSGGGSSEGHGRIYRSRRYSIGAFNFISRDAGARSAGDSHLARLASRLYHHVQPCTITRNPQARAGAIISGRVALAPSFARCREPAVGEHVIREHVIREHVIREHVIHERMLMRLL